MDERRAGYLLWGFGRGERRQLDDVLRVSDSLEAYTFVPNVRSDEELADMSLLPARSMATGGFPKKRGRI